MSVSRRLRYEVMRRDDFTCRYCHRSDVALTVDHVVPIALGGLDVPENLVAACQECNAGKASSTPDAPLVVGVSDDAIRWAAAMAQAAEIQRQDALGREAYVGQFYEAWRHYTPFSLPGNWRSDIEQWYALELEIEVLLECVDATFAAYGVQWKWKYFCGCVWRRVGERQDIAREILTREQEEGSEG